MVIGVCHGLVCFSPSFVVAGDNLSFGGRNTNKALLVQILGHTFSTNSQKGQLITVGPVILIDLEIVVLNPLKRRKLSTTQKFGNCIQSTAFLKPNACTNNNYTYVCN
jgi:hypothetical protein